MTREIVKIRREGKNYLVFTSDGALLELDKKEFVTLQKEGLDKITSGKKIYDTSLLNHNSSEPLYPAPVLAHLAITNKCNMMCKYCSVRKLHKKISDEELSTNQWKQIIKILADWGVFQIGFTGGEPTLRQDLAELAKYVHVNGCVFNLTTNGWLLDKSLVKELVSAGMKQCQVSLDSCYAEVHNKLRGNDSYERAVKSINLLKSEGVAVGIDCVVSNNNIKTIPEFIKWIKKESIPYLTLIKLKKGDLSQEDFLKLAPDYIEYSKLIRYVCAREKNECPNITLDCGSVSNLQAVAEKKSFEKIPTSGCPIGHHLICISPNGEIYACAALLDKKFCLGNILTDDIQKIWEDNNLLKEFRLVKKKLTGKCKDCERLDFCRGGCRGMVNSFSDNLFGSDPTCMFEEVIKCR